MASYRSSGDIYYLVTFFCLRSKQDVMVLSSCPAQRVCPCEHVCVCGGGVCRELVELSHRQTVPMQAVQAPEARISDAHQRNCVKAFIVIMDGQTPNWKTLDVFPSLFYFSHLTMRDQVQEECPRSSGQAYWNHWLPFCFTPPSLTICLSLSFIT